MTSLSEFPPTVNMGFRDNHGVFRKCKVIKTAPTHTSLITDHNYTDTSLCDLHACERDNCTANFHLKLPKGVIKDGWREGRRVVELGVLMDNLKVCQSCKLGPVPLTHYNIIGELQKGLSGYLYIVCQNPDCQFINRVAYGKMHHIKKHGMPCFAVNTKLGTGMYNLFVLA